MDERLTNIFGLAARLKIPRPWLLAEADAGRIPSLQIGRTRLFNVDAKQLAELLSLSVRTIRQLDAAGKLPRPARIGARAVRWSLDELREWLAAD